MICETLSCSQCTFQFLQENRDTIRKIALQTLAELGVSLAIVFAVSFFLSPLFSVSLLLNAVLLQTKVNFALRILGVYTEKKSWKKVASICHFLAPLSFYTNTAVNGVILTHEMGHAMAIRALYDGAQPRVVIEPFRKGDTFFRPHTFSSLGRRLGLQKSVVSITWAGAGAAVLLATTLLVAGIAIRKKDPTLARYCIVSAVANLAQHVFYAISALWTPAAKLSHDFVRLAAYGIHPLVSALVMIAIPLAAATIAMK